jgi:hypothetical protein
LAIAQRRGRDVHYRLCDATIACRLSRTIKHDHRKQPAASSEVAFPGSADTSASYMLGGMPSLGTILDSAAPEVAPANKKAGWLVSALVTVGLLLSAVGIGTGEVPRVLRNEWLPAGIMFALVVAGTACGASAGWLIEGTKNADDRRKEQQRLSLSAALFALAALAGVWTGIASARERPEPGITVKLATDIQGQRTLQFEVRDDGLRASDKMTVLVQALTEDNLKHLVPVPLYGVSLGPDSSGGVDYHGEVGVPPAPANEVEIQAWVGERHKCYEEGGAEARTASTGCVTVHITRLFEKPQLSLAWIRPQHSKAGLKVSLSDHDIDGHRVVLRVKDANTDHLLLDADWPSNAAGNVSESIIVVIPRNTHRMCIAASATETRPNCSERLGAGTSSVLTAVPPP